MVRTIVFDYFSNKPLGDFLSITESKDGVRIWYLDKEDGTISARFQEDIYILK